MGTCSHKATRFMVRLLYGYSNVLGTTAIRIDFAKHKVTKSRNRSIYATCINAIYILALPFALKVAFMLSNNLSTNIIFRIINKAAMLTYLTVGAVMIIFRRKRDRLSGSLAYHFFALDCAYFNRLPHLAAIERRFELMLLAKATTTFLLCATNVCSMLLLLGATDLRTLSLVFYFTTIKYVLHGVVFQSYIELSEAGKRFEILNVQLDELQSTLQAMHRHVDAVLPPNSNLLQQFYRLATSELRTISQAHWQLTCLVRSLCDNFILQILAVLCTYAIYTITFGYICILITDGSFKVKPSLIASLCMLIAYVNFLSDLYLFYWNCDVIVKAYRHTADILKDFQALPFVSEDLERCTDIFSIQLLQRKLHIDVGGMFNLNLQSLLALLAFIIRHTIIVVQSDLENRLRQKWTKVL